MENLTILVVDDEARMRKLIERCWAHDPAERPEFCERAKF